MERIIVEWRIGTVEVGRPTGRFERGADGFWREIYTDTIERDGYGREVKRTPCKSAVGFRLT